MGAGALCSLLARDPLRFERLVFVMPSVLDEPRTDDSVDRLGEMARYVDNGDVEALTSLLLDGEHFGVRSRPAVQAWCSHQAATMVRTPVSRAMRALQTAVPLADRRVLAAATAPALVIAQEQDTAHPVWVAEQLAASLPDAHLEVLAPGGILWRHRALMRDLVGAFLSGEPREPVHLERHKGAHLTESGNRGSSAEDPR
jgi:pimeloyl-ACP methyl ester carboxylesterase